MTTQKKKHPVSLKLILRAKTPIGGSSLWRVTNQKFVIIPDSALTHHLVWPGTGSDRTEQHISSPRRRFFLIFLFMLLFLLYLFYKTSKS